MENKLVNLKLKFANARMSLDQVNEELHERAITLEQRNAEASLLQDTLISLHNEKTELEARSGKPLHGFAGTSRVREAIKPFAAPLWLPSGDRFTRKTENVKLD